MHRMPEKVREVLGNQKVLLSHRLISVKREGDLYVSTFEVPSGNGGKTTKVGM